MLRVAVGVCWVLVASAGAAGPPAALAQPTRRAAEATPVNLNTATQQELQTLRGIGPATAKRIIRHRPYARTDELSRAEVAGPIIELISPWVTVKPAPARPVGR
jgi:competence protein ComEA